MDLVMACEFPALAPYFGDVFPIGDVAMHVERVAPQPRHRRMAKENAFDVCEYSLGNYLTARSAGDELPFVALPLFFMRTFRHRDIWVSDASGVTTPDQLAGKRVAVQSWDNTAAVWQRGLLTQDFDLDLRSVDWYARNRAEAAGFQQPEWLRLTELSENAPLDRMLARGEMDAIMVPTTVMPGDAPIHRLFPDFIPAERAYFDQHRVFPTMHVIVVQRRLQQEGGLVERITAGLTQAISDWVAQQKAANAPSEVWPELTWAEQEQILGPNPWAPGLQANRPMLETMIHYGKDQGILATSIEPEALFK